VGVVKNSKNSDSLKIVQCRVDSVTRRIAAMMSTKAYT
jgi:hypothetical protein